MLVDLASAPGRTLVFTRTKHGAKQLARKLTNAGVPSVDLHGNLSQNARTRNLAAFTDGTAKTLVATDIAARGIHVDDVGLVIHADPPTEHKAYLHRSGRTARAGSSGTVVTLMTDAQVSDVRDLTRRAGIKPTITRLAVGHELLAEIAPGDRVLVPPSAEVRSQASQDALGIRSRPPVAFRAAYGRRRVAIAATQRGSTQLQPAAPGRSAGDRRAVRLLERCVVLVGCAIGRSSQDALTTPPISSACQPQPFARMGCMSARLLSVNVGTPFDAEWAGSLKRTAIVKTQVEGPVRGASLGRRGDEVADTKFHGGIYQAVYAFAREDLDLWSERLGLHVPNGQFGENLTTEGIDVNEALIGERWQIGSVIVEVADVRIPCSVFQNYMGLKGFDSAKWVKRFTPGGPARSLPQGRPGGRRWRPATSSPSYTSPTTTSP